MVFAKQMNDQVELEIPPGYSLMVTAELGEDEDQGKTSYAMHIKGDDWGETISGTIKRSGGDDQDITLVADETIGEGNRRGGSIGEDSAGAHSVTLAKSTRFRRPGAFRDACMSASSSAGLRSTHVFVSRCPLASCGG